MNLIQSFLKDESGATAAEYAILLVLIVVVLIAFGTVLGDAITDRFQEVADEIEGA